jgi:hypothetical protein
MKKKLFIIAAILILIPALFFVGKKSLGPWISTLEERRMEKQAERWRAQALDWMDDKIQACTDEEDYYDSESGSRVIIRSLQTLETIRAYIERSEAIRDLTGFMVPPSLEPMVEIDGIRVGGRIRFDMGEILGKFVVIYYTSEDSLAFGAFLDEFIKDEPWFNP